MGITHLPAVTYPEVTPLAYSIDMENRQFFRKPSLKMPFSTCMLVDGRVASYHLVGFKEWTSGNPSFTKCSWKKTGVLVMFFATWWFIDGFQHPTIGM